MSETLDQIDIESFVAALQRDYSKLSIRIRELLHTVKCEHEGVTLRLHFPALAQGRSTIWEMVAVILDYMTPFALHRSQIEEVKAQYGKLSPDDYRIKCERLQREAIDQYVRAQKQANKNGEAGELLLFILTEWILKAPQLLAKLPLKTNRDVASHGTDGIHVGYLPETNTLCTYWGEAKLYADVDRAIASAVKSIKKAIQPESTEYELALVSRHLSTTGLSEKEKSLLVSFLNPFEHENYNRRVNVMTCLVGFDFDAYKSINANTNEQQFGELAREKLQELAPRFAKALKSAGIKNQLIELFFLPVPSVQDLRDRFQSKIGWK